MAHLLFASGAMHLHGWLKKFCPALCPALILTQPGLSGLESFNKDFYASCQSCCPLQRVPSWRCSLPPHLDCFHFHFQLELSVLTLH